MELRDLVTTHAELFNAAVRSGDYSAFVATFADDAVMRFEKTPGGPLLGLGPFHGRPAIAAAYADQPPTDTLTVRSVSVVDADTARVTVDYDGGGSGWMTVRWRDAQVADLSIGFGPPA